MKILFITSTRLGDAVLSTGALDYLMKKNRDVEVTVACGPMVAEIFEQAPDVIKVIALKKEPLAMHWAKLWRQVAYTPWDIVVDLRNSFISRVIPARKRYIWSRQDKNHHMVEQIGALLGVSPPPDPTLWINGETREKAATLVPARSSVLAVGPAANWPGKTWPADNFVSLLARLTAADSILPNAKIAVFAAKGEEDTAYKVLNAFPAEQRIDVIGKASPLVAAAALQNCNLYIGNDSGLTHCAAAGGIPTLGLFGPSWPQLYRPWGPRCAYVSTPESYTELTNFKGYSPATTMTSLMNSLTVDMAYDAAVALWKNIQTRKKA
jgi:heptosyltransferase-3